MKNLKIVKETINKKIKDDQGLILYLLHKFCKETNPKTSVSMCCFRVNNF